MLASLVRRLQPLPSWVALSTPRARQIVRNVLATAACPEIGLRTQEIFDRTIAEYPDATIPTRLRKFKPQETHERLHRPQVRFTGPPHPNHPIRSIKYLKTIVLADMQKAGEIEKVHVRRAGPADDVESQVSIRSKILGSKLNAVHQMTKDQMWAWKLLPRYESRKTNYPEPPRNSRVNSSPSILSQPTSAAVSSRPQSGYGAWRLGRLAPKNR